ncbi:DUF1761 domain-containing protein [Nocardioides lianchengensis]|uniref:DUF1761 domain-containing protein n=1 Tax=Nocardioides lianchengensis TaxID=1045774 RepID=A0A1G6WCN5_9ACTN|nr:DUF1761 domain-containing protein [Nocardioides lianchengensis]NYG09379.1 hypothetical protein [Nocardioides lianchengensis]SDD62997.1 Protein of unknown function [Nocardioides lianchengensis]
MFNVLGDLNWLAVVIVAVASIVLAGLWFAVVIVKPYAVALGRVGQPAPEPSVVSAVGPLVCVVVTTLTTAVLVEALDITATGDAVTFGLLVGVGYLAAMTFQIAINPNFPRPLLYGVINAPYFVITSVLGSVVMTAMR